MNSDLYISEDESNERMDECHRDISPKNDQGVLKAILQGGKGQGRPTVGDEVLIHMVGQLQKCGTIYINTRNPEQPIKTRIGSDQLPSGVSLALQTMKADEIATITCKPEYGFGDELMPVQGQIVKEIPAASTLVIELQLIDFRFNDCTSRKDGGVVRIKLDREGDGTQYPVYDSKVKCDLIGFQIDDSNQSNVDDDDLVSNLIQMDSESVSKLQGDNHPYADRLKPDKMFDKRTIEWTMGEGAAVNIPHGVEVALRHMFEGEQAVFLIRKDYTCTGKAGGDKLASQLWPSNAEYVFYQIALIKCETAKEYFQLSAEERLTESIRCKELGNQYLTNGQQLPPQMAIRRFKRAIELLEVAQDMDQITSDHQETLFACYLNISKAYLIAGTPELARPHLDNALQMRPNHDKLIYRLGCYYASRKQYDEAVQQFRSLLAKQPQNRSAQQMLNKCQLARQQQAVQERQLCKRMFKTRL